MKSIPAEIFDNLNSPTPPPISIRLDFYKKYPGSEIVARRLYNNHTQFEVKGLVSEFFSVGDKIIVTCIPGVKEVEIESIDYTAGGISKITLTTDEGDVNSNSPAYLYKKVSFSNEDILEDGLGNILKTLDEPNFNEFSSSSFDVEIHNKDYIYWNDRLRSGIFYNGAIVTTISQIESNAIYLNMESDDEIANGALAGNIITITEGDSEGQEYIIQTNYNNRCTVYPDPSGVLSVGNSIKLNIISEFICLVKVKIRNYLDKITVFGGICKPENISYNPIENKLRLNMMGFLDCLDETLAVHYCNTDNTNLIDIPGMSVKEWEIGDCIKPHYGKRDLEYITEDAKCGFEITKADPNFKSGIYTLYFKLPHYWRLDNVDYVAKCDTELEETEVSLENDEGYKLYGNFKKADFPQTNKIWYVFIENKTDGFSYKIQDRFLKIDKGDKSLIIDKPIILIKDGSFEEEVYWGEGDIVEEYLEPFTLFETGEAETIAFYIGLIAPVNKIEFKNVFNENMTQFNINWDYSVSKDGNVAENWQTLSVTDGTNGLTQSGFISFTIPEDWENIGLIGSFSKYNNSYYIRGRITTTQAERVTVESLKTQVVCESNYGDKFYFEINPAGLQDDNKKSYVVLTRKQITSENEFEDTIGTPLRGTLTYNTFLNLIDHSLLCKGYEIDEDSFKIFSQTHKVYIVGQILPDFKDVENWEKICLYIVGSKLYIAFRNNIYKYTEEKGLELISSIPFVYNIVDICKGYLQDTLLIIGVSNGNQKEMCDVYITSIKTTDDSFTNNRPFRIKDTRLMCGGVFRYKPPQSEDYYRYLLGLRYDIINDNYIFCSGTNIWSPIGGKLGLIHPVPGLEHSLHALTPLDIFDVYWNWGAISSPVQLPTNTSVSVSLEIHDDTGDPLPDVNPEMTYFHGGKGLWVAGSSQNDIRLIAATRNPNPPYDKQIRKFYELNDQAAEYPIILHSDGVYASPPPTYTEKQNIGFNPTYAIRTNDSYPDDIIIAGRQDPEILFQSNIVNAERPFGWLIRVVEKYGLPLGISKGYEFGVRPWKIYKNTTNITNDSDVYIDPDDSLYIVGCGRFAKIHFYAPNSAETDLEFYYSNGTPENYTQFTPRENWIYNPTNPYHDSWFNMPMSIFWKSQTDPIMSPTDDVWIIKIKNVDASNSLYLRPSSMKAHVWQIWENTHSTVFPDYVWPMELLDWRDRSNENDVIYIIFLIYDDWRIGVIKGGDVYIDSMPGSMNGDKIYVPSANPEEFDDHAYTAHLTPFIEFDKPYNNHRCYFVQMDLAKKENPAKLFSIEFDSVSNTVNVHYIGIIKEDCWGCSELVTDLDNLTLYGICYNNEESYLWKYSLGSSDAIEICDFSDLTTRKALNNLCNSSIKALKVSDDRKIIVTDKYPDNLTSDITLTADNGLLEIEDFTTYEHKYDVISLEYKNGKIIRGGSFIDAKMYSISADYIVSKEIATYYVEKLYKELNTTRTLVTIRVLVPFIYELLDVIAIRIHSKIGNINKYRKFAVIENVIDLKEGYGELTLLEVF